MNATTLLDTLRDHAWRTPDRIVFTFVDDDGRDQETMTFDQIVAHGDAIGAALRHQHAAPRRPRCWSTPQSLDFVRAGGLHGCGHVPVPVYPPNPLNPFGRSVELFAKLAAAQVVRPPCSPTASSIATGRWARSSTSFARGGPDWPTLPWIRTDTIKSTGRAAAGTRSALGFDDIAFLQYTSGSTSTPKGVAVNYGNLHHQLTCNRLEAGFNDQSRGLWAPQYHDFGLICGLMNGLVGTCLSHHVAAGLHPAAGRLV
ncbi:MAG: AMP-binding protein [Caldilineaceae bacterium]